jgi:uncharacterized oxidoreductase
MKLSDNKMLITGGSNGIGLGLAQKFIKENNTVIICARRKEKLEKVAEEYPSIITKTCDLTVEAERIELFNWISENHSDLNVLVNNAGIQNRMSIFDDNFYKKAKAEITTNSLAPTHLTSLFINLKSLDTLINVTSGLAFVPLSKAPVYCGTKASLHSFTLSLRHLLKDKGVEVIEMIPPGLNTELGGKGVHEGMPEVSGFVESIFQQLRAGKEELTYRSSQKMPHATPQAAKEIFREMNS